MNTRNLVGTAAVLSAGIVAAADGPRGAVCFTFDDSHGANWVKADAVFKQYQAHATFFFHGEITPERVEAMKTLQQAGHSIGLHALHHRNAIPLQPGYSPAEYFEKEVKPQLDVCIANGVKIRSFAYPNNRHDDAFDQEMFKHFDHLRAGLGPAKKLLYYPCNALPPKMVLGGAGIGTFYNSKLDELKSWITHAAETDTLIVFFSHNILPGADRINMPSEWLEELLRHARSLNMRILGFDELPSAAR
ncbi:MAG: polysaccharide deacetylase family protein [Lentisphaeria bacterium]|nr:polysaccharide deacetylase family protein [Lentisphaeria bacterium]